MSAFIFVEMKSHSDSQGRYHRSMSTVRRLTQRSFSSRTKEATQNSLTRLTMQSFQRWKATIYFAAISIVLAFTAFSIAQLHSTVSTPLHPPPPPSSAQPATVLSTNATLYLQQAGFSIAASLLLANPDTFFSSANSTVFAVQDSVLSPAVAASPPAYPSTVRAAPRLLRKQLLLYHTSPVSLPMSEILKLPPGTCFPTLVNGKTLVVTKIDAENRAAEINGVRISHPDIVIEGSVVIHGVRQLFSSMDTGSGLISPATCDAAGRNSSLLTDSVHWSKIVRSLSSKGFVAFAVGLNSVLDGIHKDYKDLKSVTIFSPPDSSVVVVGSSMDRVVRFHIVPRRISYKELMNLCKMTSSPIKTLLPGHNLEVKLNNTIAAAAGQLTVNGVQIIRTEILSSDNLVVHAISKALPIG